MYLRIADSFTDSLGKLTQEEQKAVKQTAFDLQVAGPDGGMQFHKLDRAIDKNFASLRVNRDLRIIIHKSGESLLICYVDHHDKAYAWANRRKLEVHPKTNAVQLVEVLERQEIQDPVNYTKTTPAPVSDRDQPRASQKYLFSQYSDDDLLSFGVPVGWLEEVKQFTEDSFIEQSHHLPSEASEALLELATGNRPEIVTTYEPFADPFSHPDSLRRFHLVANASELEAAMAAAWDKWLVFLHPAQRSFVERDFNGPARVMGSAGTGKTVVALHRAAFLARKYENSRILLTTFGDRLADQLKVKIRQLLIGEVRAYERIEVTSLDKLAISLYRSNVGFPLIVSRNSLVQYMSRALSEIDGDKLNAAFAMSEWDQVVDAWGITTWDQYRDVQRSGRKVRLSELQRRKLWEVFQSVRTAMNDAGEMTISDIYYKLIPLFSERRIRPFEYAVVDEAQDISIAQLRFFAAITNASGNSLFFAGDIGQRIFQPVFSWKSLGIDVRGRSRTLKINYRTSQQIRSHSDRLLEGQLADGDGNVSSRIGTISVFEGPDPDIYEASSELDETRYVSKWIVSLVKRGITPEEIGVIVRSDYEFERAIKAVEASGERYQVMTGDELRGSHGITIVTMHVAKGMEFRAVVVMACDENVIPSTERIDSVGVYLDIQEVYDTERHLFYVACTRAREQLLVSGVEPMSEFVMDLIG
jgi:hypothetical protein